MSHCNFKLLITDNKNTRYFNRTDHNNVVSLRLCSGDSSRFISGTKWYDKGWYYQTPRNWGMVSEQTSTHPLPNPWKCKILAPRQRRTAPILCMAQISAAPAKWAQPPPPPPQRYQPQAPKDIWKEKGTKQRAKWRALKQAAPTIITTPPLTPGRERSALEILAKVYSTADEGKEKAKKCWAFVMADLFE